MNKDLTEDELEKAIIAIQDFKNEKGLKILTDMEKIMSKKIEHISTIDADEIFPHSNCVLIICRNTGIYYTAQTGGMLCNHPVAEGFAIPLIFEPDYDDCKENCWISNNHGDEVSGGGIALRKDSALKLNEELKKYKGFDIKNIEFDFDRINEFTEGWWPVKFDRHIKTITMSDWRFKDGNEAEQVYEKNNGYMHCGNCD